MIVAPRAPHGRGVDDLPWTRMHQVDEVIHVQLGHVKECASLCTGDEFMQMKEKSLRSVFQSCVRDLADRTETLAKPLSVFLCVK